MSKVNTTVSTSVPMREPVDTSVNKSDQTDNPGLSSSVPMNEPVDTAEISDTQTAEQRTAVKNVVDTHAHLQTRLKAPTAPKVSSTGQQEDVLKAGGESTAVSQSLVGALRLKGIKVQNTSGADFVLPVVSPGCIIQSKVPVNTATILFPKNAVDGGTMTLYFNQDVKEVKFINATVAKKTYGKGITAGTTLSLFYNQATKKWIPLN